MSFRRYAQTDEQEEALDAVEKWAKKANYRLVFGTTIGKEPQTVILDHTHHGSEVYVNSDGTIKVNDENVEDYNDFKDAAYRQFSDEAKLDVGQQVRVMDLAAEGSHDPYNGSNKVVTVVAQTDDIVTVKFEDGRIGKYMVGTLTEA